MKALLPVLHVNFFFVFTTKSDNFMSRCESLCSMLNPKLNLASVGWRDISHVASEQASRASMCKQLDTVSQQAMHFDRFPGNVRIDLLKYYIPCKFRNILRTFSASNRKK